MSRRTLRVGVLILVIYCFGSVVMFSLFRLNSMGSSRYCFNGSRPLRHVRSNAAATLPTTINGCVTQACFSFVLERHTHDRSFMHWKKPGAVIVKIKILTQTFTSSIANKDLYTLILPYSLVATIVNLIFLHWHHSLSSGLREQAWAIAQDAHILVDRILF